MENEKGWERRTSAADVATAPIAGAVGVLAILGGILFAPVVLPLAVACVLLEDDKPKKK
jgi:hypothetical protein